LSNRLIDLEALHKNAETLERAFQDLIARKFPGRDEWDWLRACGAVRGDNIRRNDDTSQDAALAADADLEAAYGKYLDALHKFYRARDGERGVLGGRGL
jgi:hypothetical protein